MAPTSWPPGAKGSVILSALVLLVVAAVLAAGVARLVSSGAVASSDRVLVERALFALESARFSDQSCADLETTPETLPSGASFTCEPGACQRDGLNGQDVLVGFAGGDAPAEARAVERVCTQPNNLSPGDIDDCEDCELIEGDACPKGNNELEVEKEGSGILGYACDKQTGNTELDLENTDGVFFEPVDFRGDSELEVEGIGGDGIGIVFQRDVTLRGGASMDFEDTNVCFGGNVELKGGAEIEIEGGSVRFTQGVPAGGGIDIGDDTEVTEGGSCDAGSGDAWEYAL